MKVRCGIISKRLSGPKFYGPLPVLVRQVLELYLLRAPNRFDIVLPSCNPLIHHPPELLPSNRSGNVQEMNFLADLRDLECTRRWVAGIAQSLIERNPLLLLALHVAWLLCHGAWKLASSIHNADWTKGALTRERGETRVYFLLDPLRAHPSFFHPPCHFQLARAASFCPHYTGILDAMARRASCSVELVRGSSEGSWEDTEVMARYC